ncbi:MAG TPA: lipopolysaccharide heptosyltransferase II [Pyrinomonadaceae bacterium]|nr:lipopolysaccharide heptosyltransferase II [Pyrinomonadaceae bacterium]
MNILVRGTNWIGDAVMTIPAVRKLRTLFPDARLTLQTRAWAKGILSQTDLFDEIVTPDGFFDQVGTLRKGRFDLAVIFPNSFSSALAVRMSGAGRRFGYATERRSLLLTDPVELPDWKDSRHEVYYYLNLIDAVERRYFGRETETLDLEPRLAIKDGGPARNILDRAGAARNLPTVALAPGSTNSRAKRWIPERFAQLNDRLQSELNCNVILLGSKDDKEISQMVASLSSRRPFDITGETDIEEATAILGEIDLLISNDMGLAHLAPAVGTETLVIFGPTNQLTTRPFSQQSAVISANVECSPCMLRDCPIDHRCMTRISVDAIFERAKAILNNGN